MINAKSRKVVFFFIFFIWTNINFGFLMLKFNVDPNDLKDYENNLNLSFSTSDTGSPLLWSHQTNYMVQAVAISSDGNYIVSGSKNIGTNSIILFHKNHSVPLWSYNDLEAEVFSVAISSNGSYIVAGASFDDEKIYFFKRESSTPLWIYQASNAIFSVAISSDGSYIVAGARDGKIYLFHKSSSIPIWTYDVGSRDISSVDISKDGNYIVAGSQDHKLYLFERSSSTPLWSFTIEYIDGNMGDVHSVAISSDGNFIVIGTRVYQGISKVYFFNRSSSTPLWNYSAGNYINSVGISSNGDYITAGGDNYNVYLFNKSNSAPLWINNTGNIIRSVAISGDGNYITAGSYGPGYSIYLFNRNASSPMWTYNPNHYIYSVGISSDGNFITAGGVDKNVYLLGINCTGGLLTLYSDADHPDTNGEFYLYWNSQFQYDYIWIYQSNRFITIIDENVILVDSGSSINSPYSISGLHNGTYYFLIRINNSKYGEFYSNCIRINVFAPYYLEWYRLWSDEENIYGGKGLVLDSHNFIYQTGYMTGGPFGGNDGILVKTDIQGIQIWDKTWGLDSNDGGMDVAVDSFDNVYVVGTLQTSIFISKYNNTGIQIWNRTWNNLDSAMGYSIEIDSKNNIYVVGFAWDPYYIVTIRYDVNGNKIWERLWGIGGDNYRYGADITLDSDDNIYITSDSDSIGNEDTETIIVKYDSSGNQLWNKTWGGEDDESGRAICADSLNNIYVSGYTDSYGSGNRNLFLIKLDEEGQLIWNKTWSGINNAQCEDICVDSNNFIFLTGKMWDGILNNIIILMFNNNGNLLWNTTWGSKYAMECRGWGISVDSFDNLYISGDIDSYNGENNKMVLLRLTKDLNLESLNKNLIKSYNNIIVLVFMSLMIVALILKKKIRNN